MLARVVCLGLVIGSLACAAGAGREPEFSLLYTPAARHHGPERNPIIAIPGILGSKLRDPATGELAWGAFEGGAADPARPEGARLIALPIDALRALGELRDELAPSGVLDKLHIRLAGIPIDIQAYAGILATLGAGGYRDEALGLAGEVDYGRDHFTCFQFDYDWRRDNVENAQRLHAFIEHKRAYLQREYAERYGIENADVKFDIVAHSMGGLLARYFLMYGPQDLPADGSLPPLTWQGAQRVERVILIGTPNAGSAEALLQLVAGRKIGPTLPFYSPAVLGTFPSIYQLLPRSRHAPALWDDARGEPIADLLEPELWVRNKWGLADPEQAAALATLLPDVPEPERRRALALAFQRRALERARAFQAALDRSDAQPPAGLELLLVAGDAAQTPAQLRVERGTGRVSVLRSAPGDATVLRTSALLDERAGGAFRPGLDSPLSFRQVLFLPETHLGLPRSPVFRDNVLWWLLEQPRRR
jgi:pimeloyl-ACP methyl ester carboxylesterase